MKERLICFLFILPIYLYNMVEFENKKWNRVLGVISGVCLILLCCYLGVVLPQ